MLHAGNSLGSAVCQLLDERVLVKITGERVKDFISYPYSHETGAIQSVVAIQDLAQCADGYGDVRFLRSGGLHRQQGGVYLEMRWERHVGIYCMSGSVSRLGYEGSAKPTSCPVCLQDVLRPLPRPPL